MPSFLIWPLRAFSVWDFPPGFWEMKLNEPTVFLLPWLIFGGLKTSLEQINNGMDHFPYSQALKKTHIGLKQISGVRRGKSPVRTQQ